MSEKDLNNKIEFIKGVGPRKASLLNKELNIYTLNDMLHYFPFRYEDRSSIIKISEGVLDEKKSMYLVQVVKKTKGGRFRNKKLTVKVKDGSSYAELTWLKGVEWVEDKIEVGKKYLIFGKPKIYKKKISFIHPEINDLNNTSLGIHPVYPVTDKLKRGFINNRFFNRIINEVLNKTIPSIEENLSDFIIKEMGLISRAEALRYIHTPKNKKLAEKAKERLKFEELFFLQL